MMAIRPLQRRGKISALLLIFALLLTAGPAAGQSASNEENPPANDADDAAGDDEGDAPAALTADQARSLGDEISSQMRQARAMADDANSQRPLTVDQALRQVSSPRGPEQIFQWMKQNIAFEPYTGALGGPEGALVNGAANAADQALLAAEMLSEAGHSTRFVAGSLRRADAETILERTLGERALIQRDDQSIREFADQSLPLRTSLVRDIRRHIWLEVEAGDQFRPFDPVAAPTYGMTTAEGESTEQDFPAAHTVDFEMKLVSHLDDGQTLTHLTIDGPLWHLAFRSLTIGFEPDDTRPEGQRPVLTLAGDHLTGTTIPVTSVEHLSLEFSLRDPRHDHRFSQILYRRGQGLDVFDFDHQHFAVAVVPGQVSSAKVQELAGTAAGDALTALERWIDAERDSPQAADQQRLISNDLLDALGAALPLAFARNLDRQVDDVAAEFGVNPLLTRPRILTTGIFRQHDQFYVDLKVGGGRLSALPADGVPAVAAPAFLSHYGLLKDRLIGGMLSTYSDHPTTTVDAIFQLARHQRIRFMTIDTARLELVEELPIGDGAKELMTDQIRNRNMVILTPVRPVDDEGQNRFGWWAINPFDGNLEGHTSDAMAMVVTDDERAEIPRNALIEAHLRLIERHFEAADQALEGRQRFAELICTTALHFDQYSRGFCATDAAIPRAHLGTCLDTPPTPGGNVSSLSTPDCRDQLAQVRCASAYAVALLRGRLAVVPDEEASDQPLEAPLCD